MLKTIFLAITLIVLIPSIFGEEINNNDYIQLEITKEMELNLNFEDNYEIERLILDSFFFPRTYDDSQVLNNFTTTKKNHQVIEQTDSNFVRYDLSQDASQKNEISSQFIVESYVDRPKVKSPVRYPLSSVDEKYEEYLEFSGLITIDNDIRAQATQLAQGETDTYVIASKIAKWIREDIDYDLSTITQNPDQTSSEVFKSKAGVCKEITQLFVSMIRSLDIPARVVTGYSYTTSQEVIDYVGSPWGGHAWAEVLIGDKWVPFDLTYNQYGFVDASHIVTHKSKSVIETSLTSNGSGYGFSFAENGLKDNPPEFEVVKREEDKFNRGFTLSLDGPKRISSPSHGYINATISNQKDFYQVLFLKTATSQEIEVLSEQNQMMIFKPEETKTLQYKYKVPKLDENYIYTIPFLFYNDFLEKNYSVTIERNGESFEKKQLPESKSEEVSFSKKSLQLSCSSSFNRKNNQIKCSVKNPNNYEVKNSKLCVEENCKNVSLYINEEKSFLFNISQFSTIANLNYGDEKITQNITIEKPQLNITNSLHQDTLYVNTMHSSSEELSTTLYIMGEEIASNKQRKNSFTNQLPPGNHSLRVALHYNNKTFDEYRANVVVKELTFFEKILAFFRNLFT